MASSVAAHTQQHLQRARQGFRPGSDAETSFMPQGSDEFIQALRTRDFEAIQQSIQGLQHSSGSVPILGSIDQLRRCTETVTCSQSQATDDTKRRRRKASEQDRHAAASNAGGELQTLVSGVSLQSGGPSSSWESEATDSFGQWAAAAGFVEELLHPGTALEDEPVPPCEPVPPRQNPLVAGAVKIREHATGLGAILDSVREAWSFKQRVVVIDQTMSISVNPNLDSETWRRNSK